MLRLHGVSSLSLDMELKVLVCDPGLKPCDEHSQALFVYTILSPARVHVAKGLTLSFAYDHLTVYSSPTAPLPGMLGGPWVVVLLGVLRAPQ